MLKQGSSGAIAPAKEFPQVRRCRSSHLVGAVCLAGAGEGRRCEGLTIFASSQMRIRDRRSEKGQSSLGLQMQRLSASDDAEFK